MNRVVLATGAFDLLHPGHIVFLTRAKKTGELLLVGVESDRKVREAKGPGRPILSQKDRVRLVGALRCVDRVFPLPYIPDDAYLPLIATLGCTVLAVSEGDPFLKEKKRVMEQVGGRVAIVTPRIGPYSSSALIEKAKEGF